MSLWNKASPLFAVLILVPHQIPSTLLEENNPVVRRNPLGPHTLTVASQV